MVLSNSWLRPEQAAHRLRQFVAQYTEHEPEHQKHIELKLKHSLRVWEGVQRILGQEHREPRTARLAEIASLYHDLGRFPQYTNYRTFKDSASEDHGRLGFKVLRQSGLLHGLSRPDTRIVLQSVFLHNRAVLPAGLPAILHPVLGLVRDADKLDIVGVIAGHLFEEDGSSQVLTLGLGQDPEKMSRKIIHQVRNKALVNYQDMIWVNDFKLLLCSWVFALNYSASRRIMAEQGEVERLLDSLPQTEDTSWVKHEVFKALHE
ncbi:MAG: HD domain-containing protein [Desulfovermiculus sp.]